MKPGRGSCNGTFGELVQGIIGERPFLITLPIPSLRSEAVFIPDPAISDIRVEGSKVKAMRAGTMLLELFGITGGGQLNICSNIPAGKGLASSSADIVAALRAIAQSYALPLTKELVSTIAAKVEPTDGVMYEEVVAYDYTHGELIESFGALPPFILVGIDLGGTVNTVEFNQLPKAYSWQDRNQFLEAYDWVKKGFKEKKLSFICKAATMSARVNQKILPKPLFNEFEKLAHTYQGGIVVAHSGTVAGILMDMSISNCHEAVADLSRKMSLLFKSLNIKRFHIYSHKKDISLV